MLEIYNTTNRVRRVPKFRYAGQYTIPPKSAIDIEDYMADFYKPWASIGVVVRMKAGKNPAPIESKPASDAVSFTENDKSGTIANTVPITQEVKIIGKEKTEPVTEVIEESVEQKTEETVEGDAKQEVEEFVKNEEVSYTMDGLLEKGMQELKEIAASLNVVPEDTRKKSSYAEAIMAKVSK